MRPDEEYQGKHPIGVVAQRTGLSPDLIRVWERRYEVAVPTRDEGGRRLYSDRDMERLQLLAQATAEGRSIGQVAALGHEELVALVRDDDAARWSGARSPDTAASAARFVKEAMERTRELDPSGLEGVLRHAATLLGAPTFLEAVVAPFFRLIGEAWHSGKLSIAEEHLASGVARPLLGQLRGSLMGGPGAPVVVVATPKEEPHEIGALLTAAAAAGEGWSVVYLGVDVPAKDLADAVVRSKARAVALSIVFARNPEGTQAELDTLRELLPADVTLIIGGGAVKALNGAGDRGGVITFEGLPQFRAYLQGKHRKG